jgi:hypothetical protein
VLLLLLIATTCEETYVSAQRHQRDGRLLEAKVALIRCAQRDCPRTAQTDCAEWMEQVEARLPTIVVRAKDREGRDLIEAKTRVDGVSLEVEGRAIELDPGPHRISIEAPGFLPREETVTTFEGEKNRKIDLVLTPIAPPPPPTSAVGPPLWIYLAGGAGLAGMGTFAYFAITSTREYENLRAQCAPHCSESETDPIGRKQLAADLSLGVGILGLSSALVGVLIHFFADQESATVSTNPTPIASSDL